MRTVTWYNVTMKLTKLASALAEVDSKWVVGRVDGETTYTLLERSIQNGVIRFTSRGEFPSFSAVKEFIESRG